MKDVSEDRLLAMLESGDYTVNEIVEVVEEWLAVIADLLEMAVAKTEAR